MVLNPGDSPVLLQPGTFGIRRLFRLLKQEK